MLVVMSTPAMKEVDLGPTGRVVAANLARIREERGLGYADLSKRLEEAGRKIPPLGLRRIEGRARRVDADDLVALAYVLGVSPLGLLLPADGAEATGLPEDEGITKQDVWSWARGELKDFDLTTRQAFWTRNRDRAKRELDYMRGVIAKWQQEGKVPLSIHVWNEAVLSEELEEATRRVEDLEAATGQQIRVIGAKFPPFHADEPLDEARSKRTGSVGRDAE